jgi:stage II sporulation protein P
MLLSALVLIGAPVGPSAADFWGSREVASFLVAGVTPLSGASVWDLLARSVASAFYTASVPDLPFIPAASDGGATVFGAYLAYDRFPDIAANPIPPESDLTHYLPPIPEGEGPIEYTIRPQSTLGYEYYQGIFVQNGTGEITQIERYLKEKLPFSLKETGPQVLIIHTHTQEAYEPNLWEEDTRGGDDRTDDPNQSVVRVGKEVADALMQLGVPVLHDTTIYDETYNGAYTRSLQGVEKMLLRYPSIKVVLDIHRDALNHAGERRYKLVFDHEGVSTAQIMLLVGTDKGSLPHPNWESNYALALKLQKEMLGINEVFPRPIRLTRSSYHQHVAPGALLLEVGSNGNTVDEAVRAGKLFAEALAKVLKEAR